MSGGLIRCETSCKIWTSEPDICIICPAHKMPRPNGPKQKQERRQRDDPAGAASRQSLAAVSVVIFHYKNFINSSATAALPPDGWRDLELLRPLHLILDNGGLAVMLFWSISGFVFAHVYGPLTGRISGRDYAVKRFARLYPLHFLTLLYIALLALISGQKLMYGFRNNDAYHFMLQLFMASHWGLEKGLSFNGPIWSVSAEVASYVVFFLVLSRFGLSLKSALASLIVSAGLAQVLKYDIFLCCFYFFTGSLAWIGLRHAFARGAWLRWLWPGLTLVVAGGLAMAQRQGLGLPLSVVMSASNFALLTLIGSLEVASPRSFAWLKPFGDITYSSYLLHTPIQMTVVLAILRGLLPAQILLSNAFCLGYLCVVAVLSALAYRWIEYPAQLFLNRHLCGKKTPRSGLAAS